MGDEEHSGERANEANGIGERGGGWRSIACACGVQWDVRRRREW